MVKVYATKLLSLIFIAAGVTAAQGAPPRKDIPAISRAAAKGAVVSGKTSQTLTLGNSDRVQVGEEVVAIGNPLSLESTVSNGIVSGIRVVKEGGKYLQVTAPISPW